MLTIYHMPGSRSVRVVWLAEEMGIPYQTAAASMRNPTPEFKALSPLGAIPVLVDCETSMIESIAMMLYLTEKYGPTPLAVKPSEPGFARYLQFLIYAEGAVGMEVNPMIRSRFMAPDEHKAHWGAQDSERRLCNALGFLSAELGDREFIVADRFTAADIATAHAIGVGKMLVGDRAPANLTAYQDRLQQRPAYKKAAAPAG